MLSMSVIYLDHAATTPVLPEVLEAMQPFYKDKYGNPSSAYTKGEEIKAAIEDVRSFIAGTINANPCEIYFTSGGTESDNWVLNGIRKLFVNRKLHYITSRIEHHAVLKTCEALSDKNVITDLAGADENCLVHPRYIEDLLREETVLVSVMYANNEIGTIQSIKNISYLCKEHNILFHTDAVQAYGHVPVNVEEEGIDLLSASAHKFGGPKGIGFLYIRKGIELPGIILGGGQERGKRAGTENVAAIIGMGTAAKSAMTHMKENNAKIRKMRKYLRTRLIQEIPYCRVNELPDLKKDHFHEKGINKYFDMENYNSMNMLPGHLSISFQFIRGAELVALLDKEGICVSAGSACSSNEGTISHVLSAMHLPDELAAGTIRISIGQENTMEEMELAAAAIKKSVAYLRKKSSSYEDFCLANSYCL